jgi:hypothetical protein
MEIMWKRSSNNENLKGTISSTGYDGSKTTGEYGTF